MIGYLFADFYFPLGNNPDFAPDDFGESGRATRMIGVASLYCSGCCRLKYIYHSV